MQQKWFEIALSACEKNAADAVRLSSEGNDIVNSCWDPCWQTQQRAEEKWKEALLCRTRALSALEVLTDTESVPHSERSLVQMRLSRLPPAYEYKDLLAMLVRRYSLGF